MGNVAEFTDANFEADVLNSDTPVLVDFWATWCGPCIQTMPHLSKLQRQYGERVRFTGITDEQFPVIRQFLGSEGPAGQWDEVIQYNLAIDDKEMTTDSYLWAAGRSGIPCAFIVGKDARIEWIGHPAEIDDPLAAVVGGTWDRAQAKEDYDRVQALQRASDELQPKIQEAFANEEWDVEELRKLAPDDMRLVNMKMTVLKSAGRNDELLAFLTETVDANWEQPERLDVLAWGVAADGAKKLPAGLSQALRAAERAAELTDRKNVSILDTLARVHFETGDVDKAIEIAQAAVAIEPAKYAMEALQVYKAKKAEK